MFDPLGGRRTARASARAAAKDLEFLESVRRAGVQELERMLANHSHKGAPRWKRVAIRRAMSSLSPRTQEWVHGLDELREEQMDPWKRRLLRDARDRLRRTVPG